MNVELYIEEQLIEMSDQISYTLNKLFENLNDPTSIINDWSKTVDIPGTVHNNAVFGSIFRADRLLTSESGIGINFDPTKKLDMRLMYNGDLVIKGYAKLNSILNTKGLIVYNTTLSGQLGKIFQELKQLTFKSKSDLDEKYYIDSSAYVDEIMSRDIVARCWYRADAQILDLNEALQRGSMYDFIGFTPNNAKMELFDYTSYQYAGAESLKFEETLDAREEFQKTGMNGSTAIPNGMQPRGIGEYRSYHQLPYIYMNKLFLIFKSHGELLTGYEFELDHFWFNDKNPYWTDLVMMMNPLNGKEGSTHVNSYTMNLTNIKGGIFTSVIEWYKTTNKLPSGEYAFHPTLNTNITADMTPDMAKSVEVLPLYNTTTKEFELPANYSFSTLPIFQLEVHNGNEKLQNNAQINRNYGLVIEISAGSTTSKTIVVGPDSAVSTSGYNVVEMPAYSPEASSSHFFDIPLNIRPISTHSGAENIKFSIKSYWICANSAANNICPIRTSSGGQICTDGILIIVNMKAGSLALVGAQDSQRSYTRFNIGTFWNEENSLFDEIIRYCKIFGILILTDDINRKLKFTHRSTFFRDYTIEDWTDKVDYNNDFSIVPLINDCKYMLFNYKDTDVQDNKNYKEEFGYNYGEYNLSTQYQFDNNTNKIMPEGNLSIINTPNILSWTNVYNGNIYYSVPGEYYIDCANKDDKFVKHFGAYYFVTDGISNFDSSPNLNMRRVRITDDTPYMIVNNTYMYNLTDDDFQETNTYKQVFLTHSPANTYFTKTCLPIYKLPMKVFTYGKYWDSDSKGIYELFWKDWLDERLSIQNKKVTCYLNIRPLDYINFTFNKFVKIDNTLYFINKIYDYDINSIKSTKVDLISVSNIEAYYKIPYYEYFKIFVDYSQAFISYEKDNVYTGLFYIDSNAPIKFSNNSDTYIDNNIGVMFEIIDNKRIQATTLTAYSGDDDIVSNIQLINTAGETATLKVTRYSVYPVMSVTSNTATITKDTTSLSIHIRLGITDEYDEDNHPTFNATYSMATRGRIALSGSWESYQGEYYPNGPEHSSVTTQEWDATFTVSGFTETMNTAHLTFTMAEGFTKTLDINIRNAKAVFTSGVTPVVVTGKLAGQDVVEELYIQNGVAYTYNETTNTFTLNSGKLGTYSISSDGGLVLENTQVANLSIVGRPLSADGVKIYRRKSTAAGAPSRGPEETDTDSDLVEIDEI